MAQPRWSKMMIGRLHVSLVVLIVAILGGCASLPPGSDFPKTASLALTSPQETRLGRQFESAAREHGGNSGFRFVSVGTDGFSIRMQMINAAERTLDLQYFIFRGDETGRLLTDAVLHAADRGVRVRVLIDDGETLTGDDQLTVLEAHPLNRDSYLQPICVQGPHYAVSSYRIHVQRFAARLQDAQQIARGGQCHRTHRRPQYRGTGSQ